MKFLLSVLATILLVSSAFAMDAPQHEEKMVAVVLMMDDGDDQQILATVYTTLMAAEKVAKVLDVEMIAEDEVNDDVFVFSLKSEEQKNLVLKVIDEEGYETVGHNTLRVEDGNNYNALNVESLPDGTYNFQLTDENGAVKSHSLKINRRK